MTNMICPICETGSLQSSVHSQGLTYNGKTMLVEGLLQASCDCCGQAIVLPEQAKLNDKTYADAKRSSEGLWTAARILEWRMRWGLSQAQASTMLGGGANAFSKYERGEVIQSRSMDMLMRVFNDVPDARRYLASQAGEAEVGWKTVEEERRIVHTHRDVMRIEDLYQLAGAVSQSETQSANWESYEELRYGTA